VPLGRLGEPREFGWPASLVASPLQRALSGRRLDRAADDWWVPRPPPSLVAESGAVSTEEGRRS
jgi:hypothetical protein